MSFHARHFWCAQKVGGQVIGAFDTEIAGAASEGGPESLVGFVHVVAGDKTGKGEPRPYLHSHMLAVREGYRNRGLGAQLKLEQRREALARNSPHRMDLRSPGDQERFSEYPQAGSDCSPLSGGFLWCILISTAGWASD